MAETKSRLAPGQSLVAKSAVREQSPPKVKTQLYDQNVRPTETERELIREMYEWEKQSARVQFRVK